MATNTQENLFGNMAEKQIIFNYVAGSQAYGLETPASDTDFRGVFLLDDPALIIDPYRYTASSQKCVDSIKDGVDTTYHELRHFFNILHNANTNAIEMLFVEKYITSSPLFDKIRLNRNKLISPEKFYKSLKGYIMSESKLAVGDRTGKLGGKRYAQVEKHGFSPKNFVQLHRLAYAGKVFFQQGFFPVNMKKYPEFRKYLMEIKTEPECHSKMGLQVDVGVAERDLDAAYAQYAAVRSEEYRYDSNFVTEIMLEAYGPIIQKHMPKKKTFFGTLFSK